MKLDDILATLHESILLNSKGDKELAAKVIRDIQKAASEEKEERAAEKGPKKKSQLVCLINDPENQLNGKAYTGWVVQMDADTPPMAALDKARAAGHAFNQTKKGRKKPVKSLLEVFSSVPRKHWKNGEDTKTMSKTREPVLFQPTDGSLGQPASF